MVTDTAFQLMHRNKRQTQFQRQAVERHLPELQYVTMVAQKSAFTDLHAMNSSFAGVGISLEKSRLRSWKQNTESLRNQLFDYV